MLRGIVAARWILVPAYLGVALLFVWIFGSRLGVEIFPRSDSGQFALRLRAATGTKIESTEAIALHQQNLTAELTYLRSKLGWVKSLKVTPETAPDDSAPPIE